MEVGDGVESGTAAPAPLLRRPYVLIVVVERMGVAAAGRAESRAEFRVPRRVAGGRLVVREGVCSGRLMGRGPRQLVA